MEKFCLECLKPLIIKITRDIIRKKFCSQSCRAKYYQKQGLYPPLPRPKEQSIKKASNTRSIKMRLGLIPKPPQNRTKKVYFCPGCNKEIYPKSTYCWACYKISKNKISVCLNCKKNFVLTYSPNKTTKMKFCCKKCQGEYAKQNRIEIKCISCGKIIHRPKSLVHPDGRNYCSISCLHNTLRNLNGSKSKAYIDGRTPLRKLVRSSAQYKNWIAAIIKTADYKCISCGITEKLHVHHNNSSFSELLYSFYFHCKKSNISLDNLDILLEEAKKFSPFWDINNGIPLCKNCHQKKHPNVNLFK